MWRYNQFCDGVCETINAALTKPFGFMLFIPGPGIGGHSLPIDSSYLSWRMQRALGRGLPFVDPVLITDHDAFTSPDPSAIRSRQTRLTPHSTPIVVEADHRLNGGSCHTRHATCSQAVMSYNGDLQRTVRADLDHGVDPRDVKQDPKFDA